MKTDQVQNKQNHSHRTMERVKGEAKHGLKEAEETKYKKEASESESAARKQREAKMASLNQLDGVKKMIGENIEWRQMRFYRNEKDGKAYIDIVNKETGEVLRTVPEPEMHKIATQFKHLSGMTLDING